MTRPLVETVATAELDEAHVAELDTFGIVPSESVAVAVSWLV